LRNLITILREPLGHFFTVPSQERILRKTWRLGKLINREMESYQMKKGNAFKYIVFVLLAFAAIGIGMHLFGPKEADVASNKNMLLFIQNKITDIDRELLNKSDGGDIATRVSWHKSNTALYLEVKDNKDEEVRRQTERLKDRILKVQTLEFPDLRQDYVNSKKDALHQQSIEITLSGEKKDVLIFEGGVFASKKNKKVFMKNIDQIIHDLRFHQVVYKWADGKDGNSMFKIDSKKDSEL
jgi:hypothetical protein